MWHHFIVFFLMLAWMAAPIACYAAAPRKQRDPYLWVAGATLFGPLVALVFFGLPAKRA
jgi:hypothetical protein